MVRPKINTIKPDIKNATIYLRSTKKFGKTTLFRDVILTKYNDPSRGLLIGCGNEVGYTMLDALNVVQVKDYKELKELKDWLIREKGKEHNIEIIAFDTGDELTIIADQETIRLSNIENPTKKVKSIKAAFGGYTAGEKFSANNVIKPLITELRDAGFGVWVLCHTKYKSIKEKGGLEEDGYMQLTSNLSADYESAFGDIFDIVLTGVIDREIEEKNVKVGNETKTKRYTKDTTRKLYFRGTTLIDAGGRFAPYAVKDYIIFDEPDMSRTFIKTIEEGMENSKKYAQMPQEQSDDLPEDLDVEVSTRNLFKSIIGTDVYEDDEDDEAEYDRNEDLFAEEEDSSASDNNYPDNLKDTVKDLLKNSTGKLKEEGRTIVKSYGKFNDVDEEGLKKIYDLLSA